MNKILILLFAFLLLLPFTGCAGLLESHFRYTLTPCWDCGMSATMVWQHSLVFLSWLN